MLGKIAADIIYIFYFFQKKGDNLYEMSNPIFWKKNMKKIISLSPAKSAHIMVSVKCRIPVQLIVIHMYI